MKKNIIFYLLVLMFLFLATPRGVWTAGETYRLEVDSRTTTVGNQFKIRILADSPHPLNGYSFSLNYSADLAKLVSTNDAGSIVDIWRTKAQVFEGGRINFEGVSVKPFAGKGGFLYELIFEAKKAGDFKIGFAPRSFVYLANGKGTRVDPTTQGLVIKMSPSTPSSPSPIVYGLPEDKVPPKIEEVSITDDPIREGQRILSYLVKDADSGVKDVRIRLKSWFNWSDYILISNALSLPKGVWAVDFLVTDNSGNLSETTIYYWESFLFRVVPIVIVVILIVLMIINKFLKRKKV